MALLQRDLFNSPYAGVFCATNDVLTLIPPGIPKDDTEAISDALGTTVEPVTIGGSRVVGTLAAMNSQGLLVSNIVTSREIEKLEKLASDFNLRLGVISDRSNAIGNNFLVNDNGGFCNERLGSQTRELAEEILGVEITPKSLNQMDTLGMIGCNYLYFSQFVCFSSIQSNPVLYQFHISLASHFISPIISLFF